MAQGVLATPAQADGVWADDDVRVLAEAFVALSTEVNAQYWEKIRAENARLKARCDELAKHQPVQLRVKGHFGNHLVALEREYETVRAERDELKLAAEPREVARRG